MIILKRGIPSKLRVLESLLRRGQLNEDQKQLFENQLWRVEIGYIGECRADEFWEDLAWSEPHFLFHDYETVNSRGYSHQIDSIFLNQNFVFITELKHISGILQFDQQTHQFTRMKKDGQLESFLNPFDQVERHQAYIQSIVWKVGLELPVISGVIITQQSAVIQNVPQDALIFQLSGLSSKMKQLKKHFPTKISVEQLTLLKEELLHQHCSKIRRPMIENIPIQKGALCKNGHVMQYAQGKFKCSCGEKSRHALIEGLHDYKLLIQPTITNAQFRDFFSIPSIHAASKILKRLDLPYQGEFKNRVYTIPDDL
ncbi:nuclease-related domain-containing protein [Lysinibacillus sp. 54212]|uniref:nuclease-related domain-containing protein n=1 Tax=Lysinibacillus sp. 54212 TaxID=3119829 RepID=UPI002FC9763A